MRIVHRGSTEVEYFQPTQDAVGRSILSPLQKCTATIFQLAYDGVGLIQLTNMYDLVKQQLKNVCIVLPPE